MTERKLLTWKHTEHASWRGIAGGIELFVISWHIRREDPNYVLKSLLTGLRLDQKDDDKEKLMAAAEAALARWLARVGGTT